MDFVRNLEECLILAFEMNTSCLDYSNQTINQLSNKNQWRGGSPPPNGYQMARVGPGITVLLYTEKINPAVPFL